MKTKKQLEPELEKLFEEKRLNFSKEIFIWTSVLGLDDIRYGNYRSLRREHLENREYVIEHYEEMHLLFTDAWHVRTNEGWKTILKKDISRYILTELHE